MNSEHFTKDWMEFFYEWKHKTTFKLFYMVLNYFCHCLCLLIAWWLHCWLWWFLCQLAGLLSFALFFYLHTFTHIILFMDLASPSHLLKPYSSSTAQLLPLCTFPQNTRLGTNLFLTQDWKHTILSTLYVALCTFCLGLMIFVSAICFLYNSNILEREN